MAAQWSWFKFDCGAHAHPKIATLNNAAFRTLTRIWALARLSPEPGKVYMKPGQGVPFTFIVSSAGVVGHDGAMATQIQQRLVENGLIAVDPNGVILVNDFEQHNHVPPSHTTEGERERKRSQREKKKASQPVSQGMSQPSSQPAVPESPKTEKRREEKKREDPPDSAAARPPDDIRGVVEQPASSPEIPAHLAEWIAAMNTALCVLLPIPTGATRNLLIEHIERLGVDQAVEASVAAAERERKKTRRLPGMDFFPAVLKTTLKIEEVPANGDPVVAAIERYRAECPPWAKVLETWPRRDILERRLLPLEAAIVGTELVLTAPDRFEADFLRDAGYVDQIAKAAGLEWSVRIAERRQARSA